MATTPDYPILGPPRISEAGFTAVLRANRSPALGEAAACYRAALAHNVDPAVLLAMFGKESTYGRFGVAARTRGWGNIREPATGQFRAYSSWTAGANDTARLLGVYGRNAIRPGVKTDTVQTMPFVWAPAADGNAPDRYGDQLAAWITDWQRRYSASGSGPGVAPSTDATPASGVAVSEDPMKRDRALALLREAGLPTDSRYVFTAADAERIANLYVARGEVQAGGRVWRKIVDEWTGKTVADFITASVETGDIAEGGLADVLADLPAALGRIGTNIVLLVALAAMILVGLYLLARS